MDKTPVSDFPSQQEHTALKRGEAARAVREASNAIESPPAATNTVLRASTSLSALTIKPAPIGCSPHAQMATVIAIGPAHIRLALAHINPIIKCARANDNIVTVVVLGVQDNNEAEAALKTPIPRILLAGARELKVLRKRDDNGFVRNYLHEAVLVGLVQGSVEGYGDDGLNGVWCLPSAPVPLDKSTEAIEPRGDKTMAKWQLAINTQWSGWYTRYNQKTTELDEKDISLLQAYTSFPEYPRHPPVSQLPRLSIALMAMDSGPVFGTIDHTILWRGGIRLNELLPFPCKKWATTSRPGGSPYWAVASWCTNTQSALKTSAPSPDVELTFDQLQYDVLCTTRTAIALLKRAEDVEMPRGVLGPVVLAGRSNNEPMRVSWWTSAEGTPLLMLLPEAYVHIALKDYDSKHVAGQRQALLCSQGFLVLANEDEVPIKFAVAGLTASEPDGKRAALGPRLWHVRETAINSALLELHDAPAPRDGRVSYRTQTDAEADWARGLLKVGARVGTSRTHSVFYTNTTSEDQLSGLRVRWTGPYWPVLDVDTVQESSYERVK